MTAPEVRINAKRWRRRFRAEDAVEVGYRSENGECPWPRKRLYRAMFHHGHRCRLIDLRLGLYAPPTPRS